MRHSTKSGYAAIAEVLGEPLVELGFVEGILEGVYAAVADAGCGMHLPDVPYRNQIGSRRI